MQKTVKGKHFRMMYLPTDFVKYTNNIGKIKT